LIEGAHRLHWQAVDKVDAQRMKPLGARRIDDCPRLFGGLDAVDRDLHVRVQILHAQAYAVEPEPAQEGDVIRHHGTGIHLDADLGGVALRHVEVLVGCRHQALHLILGQEGRRATAPVQLRNLARTFEQASLGLNLLQQPPQVVLGTLPILRDDLVASAVETNGRAERDVKIQ
jgi:hypothetical protein